MKTGQKNVAVAVATCGALLSTATATHLQRPRNEAHEAHEARAGARGARAGVAIVADLTNDKYSIEKNTLQNLSTVFTGGLWVAALILNWWLIINLRTQHLKERGK